MLTFILGALAGAFIIMMLPPEKEDWLRQWFITQWQNITKKG